MFTESHLTKSARCSIGHICCRLIKWFRLACFTGGSNEVQTMSYETNGLLFFALMFNKCWDEALRMLENGSVSNAQTLLPNTFVLEIGNIKY